MLFSVPFLKSIPFPWAEYNLFLQAVLLLLSAALICHAVLSYGIRNAALLFAVSFLVSYAAEAAGVRWTWPFSSRYHYHPEMTPKLPGGVPLCIPLVWYALAYSALVFLRPLSIGRNGSRLTMRLLAKALWCALFIVGTDLVIDPLGVLSGAWIWHEPGTVYFGVPLGNFLGWFLVGFIICGAFLALEGPSPVSVFEERLRLDGMFVAASVFQTGLCFAGCIVNLNSAVPVVSAAAFMLPCWIYWIVSASKIQKTRNRA